MADANANASAPPPLAADAAAAAAAAAGDEEVEEEPSESDDEFVPTTVEGAAEWLKEAASADPLDFDGACVAFTQVLKYFAARKKAEEAEEVASLAELPTATLYAVALLRRYQKAANAMDASALQALGVSDGAQEPGETEATLAEDLYHSGHFFKVAVDGYTRLCALEAAAGTDGAAAEAAATVAAVRAEWAALGQDAAAVLGVQLSAVHSGFAEVMHELNNCELAAEHYALAAEALPAEGYGERAAIAYGNQGLELRAAGDKAAMGAACRKSMDILRTLPQTAAVKKHLECMQEFADDTLDPETVKAVAKNQVVGSAEGMVIHSGNQDKKRTGPVNTLQAKKRRVGPASPAK